jgi:acyl carrier protein
MEFQPTANEETAMDHLQVVREFVIDNFLFGDQERITKDTSFIESGIVDSTGIVELMAFLEETYGIIIEDEEVVPENFDSLTRVVAFIGRKLNGRQ